MRQTAAIFLDAYRELNAKKLFWIVLGLSGLCVSVFAGLGLNSNGLNIFGWQWNQDFLTTDTTSKEFFYKELFSSLGVNWWLTRIATVLALVSTAGIIPTFISSGSIDLVLAKPIGRVRLFFTKYLTGLLFVTLQVIIFCVASFLVIGLRAGTWEPGLFVAIPLVVLFFSYLFSVCVLLGLLTRSTIASLLITILLWVGIFGVNQIDNFAIMAKTTRELRMEKGTQMLEAAEDRLVTMPDSLEELRGRLTDARARLDAMDESDDGRRRATREVRTLEVQERNMAQLLEEQEDLRDRLNDSITKTTNATWPVTMYRITYAGKFFLPKTAETVEILQRVLVSMADLEEALAEEDQPFMFMDPTDPIIVSQGEVLTAVTEAKRSRTVLWVIGTSMLFQGVILGLSCMIFCRRDF